MKDRTTRVVVTLISSAMSVIAVSACQLSGTPASRTNLDAARVAAQPSGINCGTSFDKLGKGGGRVIFPSIEDSGNYSGYVSFGPIETKATGGNPQAYFYGCVYDFDDIPIPDGYLYDWFGSWRIQAPAGYFSFGNATLYGELNSDVWVKKRKYFLFLYTSDGQVIASEPMGPFKGKALKFASPFENGLVYPGTSFELEVAHAVDSP